MAISPSCSRSGLISRERETRPETCNRTEGRRRGVGPDRPMQVSGLVSRSREIRPLREQDGLIAIENLEEWPDVSTASWSLQTLSWSLSRGERCYTNRCRQGGASANTTPQPAAPITNNRRACIYNQQATELMSGQHTVPL
ncbi:hypothetical protein Bbelb_032890 [Branchiostoma belcheri]|nr:hypothetical protein Bbelb_032890 [Branchiostoma belcheri]